MPLKAKENTKTSRKGSVAQIPEPSIAPSSAKLKDAKTKGQDKTTSQRDIVATFQSELEKKQYINDLEVKKTLGQIHYLRKENDRFQRKQTAEYGMTLDMMEELKHGIETTKSQNLKLFTEMEETRALHDKLHEELVEAKRKYADKKQSIQDFKKEKRTWNDIKMKEFQREARCNELMKVNKRLRVLLLKHHIDPNTDEIRRVHEERSASFRSNKTFPKISKKKLVVKGRYDTAADSDWQVNETMKRYHITPAKLDQISPAYWGFYMRRKKEKSVEKAYYRTGINLPGILI